MPLIYIPAKQFYGFFDLDVETIVRVPRKLKKSFKRRLVMGLQLMMQNDSDLISEKSLNLRLCGSPEEV